MRAMAVSRIFWGRSSRASARRFARSGRRGSGQGAALSGAAEKRTRDHGLSSAHGTFIAPDQLNLCEKAGWLIRQDQQFHWTNEGYGSFEDFLGALQSRKRKALRKERAAALEDGITVDWLTGDSLTEAHWDVFWRFYQDTGARKWGQIGRAHV